MRLLLVGSLFIMIGACAPAEEKAADDKKGVVVELAGLKSTTPGEWKEEPLPAKSMRMHTFKLPKAEGDAEDADLALFFFRGNAGSVQDNLARQEKKFEIPAGKKPEDAIKVTKTKVGTIEGVYQDIQGTFLKKDGGPFDPNAKVSKVTDYRQLYVIFETKDGQYYMTLIGPAKTIEKHKAGFEEWLKNFK